MSELTGGELDAAEVRLQRLINMMVEFAVDAVGCDGATLTMANRGTYSTVRTSDARLVHIDEAQYEARSGPCVEASGRSEPVIVDDFAEDERWRNVAQLARELGVRSSLSVGVRIDHDQELAGSVNFYSRRPRRFGDEQVRSGKALAAQLGAALSSAHMHQATARLASEMAAALKSRAVIDQAKGMIMRARGCNADEAFDVLRRVSQSRNTRLAEIAARVVEAAQSGEEYDLT
jgi:GAF domain-containing protein